jgi:cytochrome c5
VYAHDGARRLAAVLLLAGCVVVTLAGAAGDKPPRRAPYALLFPPGKGRDLAERSCRTCHSAMLITQQAKDSTAWEKTIVQMEKWGVQLSPAEHDTLRGYLVGRFGRPSPK